MLKLLIIVFFIAIISIASVWLIENDGSIVVEWMGYQIETSITLSVLLLVFVFLTLFLVFQILIAIKNAPKNYQKSVKDKKKEKGLTAVTEGFAAIAAGDAKQAKKLTKQAVGCLGNVPVTKLLSAQSAQLEGNMGEAKVHYNAMLESKETKMIAIKGLLLQAEKDGDLEEAIKLAEKAIESHPNSDWAIKVLLRLYKLTKRWSQAHSLTSKAAKLKIITREKARRDMAVMSLAQSQDSKEESPKRALEFAHNAYKELPTFAPAVTIYSSCLLKVSKSNKRKVLNILEKCWKLSPHPQISQLYMETHAGETAAKKLKAAEKLVKLQPNDINSHIEVAKAAILSDNPSKARNHLKIALNIQETPEICNMMADVEKMENADEEAIAKWTERSKMSSAETMWVCEKCSASQPIWNTSCDNCTSFDSLKWSDGKSVMDIVNSLDKAPEDRLAITDGVS